MGRRGSNDMNPADQTKESVKIARAALEAETHEVVQVSERLHENLGKAVRRTWRQLLLVWAVVVALAVSYFLVLTNVPKPAKVAKLVEPVPVSPRVPSEAGKPAILPLPPAKTHPDFAAIPEGEDLLKVLNQIREAQLKKDIQLFLEAYSPSFADLGQKREVTLNIWRRYDYIDLQFQLSNMQRKDVSNVLAHVTWNIKARDHKTDTIRTLTKSYQVQFSRDISGKWLIQKLEAVEDKET